MINLDCILFNDDDSSTHIHRSINNSPPLSVFSFTHTCIYVGMNENYYSLHKIYL